MPGIIKHTSMLAVTIALAGCAAKPPVQVAPAALQRIEPLPATQPADQARWYDAAQLDIEGRGWTDTPGPYDRLPARAESKVRQAVWNLSRRSAGLCVHFVTDSSNINARWTVTSNSLAMNHMPATGVSGLDLYVRSEGRWRWVGNGRPVTATTEAQLVGNLPKGPHECLLFLPLYNGTQSLQIGLTAGATMSRPAPRKDRAICVYGTSIDQGGCASRPGMAWTAIISRRLDRPVVNLGFSGNGWMEPEMAELLSELDPAVYVLNCLHNMKTEWIAERVEPFVLRLRKSHPATPIILVEATRSESGLVLPNVRKIDAERNQMLQAACQRLIAQGVGNLHYVPATLLLGTDGEATVDGVHPTDLGFLRMADALEPALRKALRGR